MRARLFCKTGELAGAEHRIGDEATIGRSAQNAIVLASGVVSHRHARIVFDPIADAYFLEDLHSKNGTRLDGAQVANRERLSGLNVITLGEEHDFIFVAVPDRPSRGRGVSREASATSSAAPPAADVDPAGPATVFEPASAVAVPPLVGAPAEADGNDSAFATIHEAPSALRAPPLAPATGDAAAASAGSPTVPQSPSALHVPPLEDVPSGEQPDAPTPPVVFEIRVPDHGRRRITLSDGRHVVGRAAECDVMINDRTLSREHAVFVVRAGTVTLEDLDSQNGTYVGDSPARGAVTLRAGQRVTFGQVEAVWVVS